MSAAGASGAAVAGVGAAAELLLLPMAAARIRADALAGAVTGVRQAAGRIRTSATQSAGILRQIKADAGTGARSLVQAARGATSLQRGLTSLSTSARRVRAGLRALDSKAGGLLSLVGGMVLALPPIAKLMDALGKVMTIASVVMTAVNLLSKTTPIGAITGILLPLASQLIDLAVNSEAGQRIVQQIAAGILKGVPVVLKVMAPILTIVAKVVATYFTVYLTVIVDVLKVLGAVIGGGFTVMRALTSGHLGKLRGIASGALRGLKNAVQPIVDWVTHRIPDGFTRAKKAVVNTLNAAGGFLRTAMQAVIGTAKAPLQGLIAFANWIIRGLNKIHFSIFGHGFGVHIDEIPMLAEGGIVLPPAARSASRVLPLSQLDRQLALGASLHRTDPASGPHRIAQYRETASLGPNGTAEELLFLAGLNAA